MTLDPWEDYFVGTTQDHEIAVYCEHGYQIVFTGYQTFRSLVEGMKDIYNNHGKYHS